MTSRNFVNFKLFVSLKKKKDSQIGENATGEEPGDLDAILRWLDHEEENARKMSEGKLAQNIGKQKR